MHASFVVRARRSTLAALALVLGLAVGAAGQSLPSRLLRYSAVLDGKEEQALRWPIGVAAGGAEEVAVADAWKSRLVLFRRIGAGWGIAAEVALAAPPAAVARVGDRYLVALRGSERLVGVRFAEEGPRTEDVPLPDGVLAGRLADSSDGGLLVWDARGHRVLKLQAGRIVTEVELRRTVTALASDGAGGFWAAMGEAGELVRHDATGRQIAVRNLPNDGPVPAWPSGIALDSRGNLFVLDRYGHRVIVLDAEGNVLGFGGGKGSEPGLLLRPGGLARLPTGAVLVGDDGNGRVQLFDVVGGQPR